MQQATPPTPMAGILTIIVLVLAVVAIIRSPRKLHSALYIVGAILICGLVGIGIGLAFKNPQGASALGAIAMQFGGIAASIDRIRLYRKSGPSAQ